MQAIPLTQRLKEKSAQLGFTLSGVCPAITPAGIGRFNQWLESGYAGQMHYLAERAEAYRHPRHVLDGVRSVLMLAMNYATAKPQPTQPATGRVARYAWGSADYHDLIHARLKQLKKYTQEIAPDAVVRGVVDTAPLLEREFAQLAGLGWVGKNTLLLNRQAGSYFFLAALLLDCELAYDAPHETNHCGSCRACLDACPTDAFPQPYVLDASRCISYLTIELREEMPVDLREGVGDWLFGCDVCQEVCPWNREVPTAGEECFTPSEDLNPVALPQLFALDDDAFRAHFRKSPLWRPRRRGLLRNAAIVLGNNRSEKGLQALGHGLNDEEPLVRGAAAWALGRYSAAQAAAALSQRLAIEENAQVRSEIEAALQAAFSHGEPAPEN